MFSLVFAGEAIFCLPFHVSRYFRPAFVDVFQISQTQLGVLGSIYGFVAMFAYLLGGGLADRFSARKLLAFSLVVTGLSGFYLAALPSFPQLRLLYGFWGVSTILTFWSALIRATRDWGGHEKQGEAFGILDGGRGLLAAVLATLVWFLFAWFLPADDELATLEQRTAALRCTIFVYTLTNFVAAALVWFLVPETPGSPAEAGTQGSAPLDSESPPRRPTDDRGHFLTVLKMPAIWLQAAIIVCAYATFKGIDYYSQYARDIWEWSEVDAAGLSAYSTWMRPVAAVAAGLVADRWRASRVVIGCFLLTAASYLLLVVTAPAAGSGGLLWAIVLVGCAGLFGLRGIYFALLEESEVPRALTGTAVGVVSFIGYTPEIFMPLLGGWLIDRWSGGDIGYQALFVFLIIASVLGVLVTAVLRRVH
jgi:sugar phosphate permease